VTRITVRITVTVGITVWITVVDYGADYGGITVGGITVTGLRDGITVTVTDYDYGVDYGDSYLNALNSAASKKPLSYRNQIGYTVPRIMREGVMAKRAIRSSYRSGPPPSVIAQRSPLAPETRSAFGQTNENLDAQNAWEAHIAAGRIEVK
jgi:hypothetical protein